MFFTFPAQLFETKRLNRLVFGRLATGKGPAGSCEG